MGQINTENTPLEVFGSMSIYRLWEMTYTAGPIVVQKAEFNQKQGLCMVKKEKLTIGKQGYF